MNTAIRVTRAYDDMGDWSSIFDMCEKVVVYEHQKDATVKQTHVHMYLGGYTRKEDTLRMRIKALGYKGVDFALKVKKEDGSAVDDSFITYMSKGNLLPKFVKGFDDGFIEQRKSEWVERRSTVRLGTTGKLVRESDDRKVKTKKQLLELMVAEIPDGSGTRAILEGIRKVLVKENQVIGQYKMLDYYDSYIMYEQKEKWLDGLVSKINSRLGI